MQRCSLKIAVGLITFTTNIICSANQWTGFSVKKASVMKELRRSIAQNGKLDLDW